MALTSYRSHLRRKQKKPQGFVPTTFLTDTNTVGQGNNGDRDMSQVDFGNRSPVIAARMNRNIGRNTDDSTGSVPTSPTSPSSTGLLSPLLPAITRSYEGRTSPTRQTSTASALRTERNSGGSFLTSPYSEHAGPVNYSEVTSASGSQASPPKTGSLHSDMHTFQKALEADNEKQVASGPILEEPANDPPPSYSMR